MFLPNMYTLYFFLVRTSSTKLNRSSERGSLPYIIPNLTGKASNFSMKYDVSHTCFVCLFLQIVFVKLSFHFQFTENFYHGWLWYITAYYSSDFIQTLPVSSLVVSCTPGSNPVFHSALSCNSGDSFFSLYFLCDLDNLEETVQIYYRMLFSLNFCEETSWLDQGHGFCGGIALR